MPNWIRPFLTGVLVTVLVTGSALLLTRPGGGEAIEVLIATPVPGTIGVAVSGAVRQPGVFELPSGSRVADLLAAAGGVVEGADPAVPSRALRLRDEMHIHVPWAVITITPTAGPPAVQAAASSLDRPTTTPQPGPAAPTPAPATVAPTTVAQVEATPTPLASPKMADTAPAPATNNAPELVNLNTASAAELEVLPGIGPALAARIVSDRDRNGPFTSIDDLQRVSGIGPATVARLRALVRV